MTERVDFIGVGHLVRRSTDQHAPSHTVRRPTLIGLHGDAAVICSAS